MAKAKKLPSGSWRVQVFSHYEYTQAPDGTTKKKRIYESFTCDDPSIKGKKEAERLAAVWSVNRESERPENITLWETITRYIEAKSTVLSPSTIAGYKKMQRNYFESIGTYPISQINNTIVQVWVSDLSAKLSPKSVRNIYTLLSSALTMFRPDMSIRATLPAKQRTELYTPNDEDIKRLLEHIEGKELEIAVLLAAFGPMRRGEICALEASDIHGNIIQVKHSMVRDEYGEWVIKAPKTYSSYREIEYPAFVIEKLQHTKGRIIQATPDQITSRFQRAVKSTHLPHFRFHDLRHYAASIMHAIGVPDQYIMARGGWVSAQTMQTVYRNVIDLEAVKQNKKINEHFADMQHEIQHAK